MPSIFSATTTLFGIGITFESHHAEALRHALSAFPPEDGAVPSGEQRVRIVLVAGAANGPGADSLHTDGMRLDVVERGVTVKADGERGCGVCIFHPSAVDTAPFANGLNTAVLFLVAQAGRIPLHASG